MAAAHSCGVHGTRGLPHRIADGSVELLCVRAPRRSTPRTRTDGRHRSHRRTARTLHILRPKPLTPRRPRSSLREAKNKNKTNWPAARASQSLAREGLTRMRPLGPTCEGTVACSASLRNHSAAARQTTHRSFPRTAPPAAGPALRPPLSIYGRIGTEPFQMVAAEKPIMPIMARRPFESSLFCAVRSSAPARGGRGRR